MRNEAVNASAPGQEQGQGRGYGRGREHEQGREQERGYGRGRGHEQGREQERGSEPGREHEQGRKQKQKHLAGTVQELLEKRRIIVTINGSVEIGVFAVDGQYYAYRNLCPHAAAPVCEGPVCGTRLPSLVYEYEYGRDLEIVRCPWHGWEFDLTTGRHLADEDVKLRGYPVEVQDDKVYVLA